MGTQIHCSKCYFDIVCMRARSMYLHMKGTLLSMHLQ